MDKNTLEIDSWAISHEAWRESARGVLTDNWDMNEEIDHRANEIISKVLRGSVSVQELRGGVAWANALDEEASTLFGSETTEGNYVFERTARRIMHHAGKVALEQMKNSRRRTILSVTNNKYSIIKGVKV